MNGKSGMFSVGQTVPTKCSYHFRSLSLSLSFLFSSPLSPMNESIYRTYRLPFGAHSTPLVAKMIVILAETKLWNEEDITNPPQIRDNLVLIHNIPFIFLPKRGKKETNARTKYTATRWMRFFFLIPNFSSLLVYHKNTRHE